ncbi:MAG: hypothetical protein ABIU63_15140, partial [Chitinophagaceae bacterium]
LDVSGALNKIPLREVEDLGKRLDSTMEEEKEIYRLQNDLIDKISSINHNTGSLEGVAHLCKAIRKPQDKLLKQVIDTIINGQRELQLNKIREWKDLDLKVQLDTLKNIQQQLSGNPDEEEPGLLHETEYFYKQANWLTSRFPDGVYADVEGLCKVVSQAEIEAKDWSLSPGRYVGVDTATDDDFDYEERLNEIHIELNGLNEEAIALANAISENYKTVVI